MQRNIDVIGFESYEYIWRDTRVATKLGKTLCFGIYDKTWDDQNDDRDTKTVGIHSNRPSWGLRSSRMLRGADWQLYTGAPGQPIGSVFKRQAVIDWLKMLPVAFTPQKTSLVLTSVRGQMDPAAIVRLAGLRQWKIQWHSRTSNPRPFGLKRSASTNWATGRSARYLLAYAN
jgi:hypothetical protein